MTDTRKDKRAPISLKVRFKSATVDEFIEQYAKDISKGGIFIKSNKNSPPMPIGTLLKFEFQLKDESKLIQGVGRVVWKRELEGSSEDDPAGMGIKFIKMDPESKTLVDQIVAGRGESPGQFEAGGGGLGGREEPDSPTASTGTSASQESKRPIRSQKATMQFFPSTTPQNEMPKPEDRTQVRHASEFLASALGSAGVDEAVAGEAEKGAEEARARTAEIDRERDEQAKKAREDEDKKARAEKERQERERAEAEEKAATKEKAAAAAVAEAAPKKKATSDRPPEKAAAKTAKTDDKKAAPASGAAKKKQEAKPAVVVAARPAEEPSSAMPAFAAVILVVAVAGWYLFGRGGNAVDENALPPPPPSTIAEVPPTIVEPPVSEIMPPPSTAVVDVIDPLDEVDEVVPPPSSAVVTHDVRVESTPASAIIVVDGEERGAAPQTLTLAEGEHHLEARLPGYRAFTQTVQSAAGTRPVRITLAALPYRVHVTTMPAGARVRIAGRAASATGDLTVPRPTAPLALVASLAGYVDANQTIAPSAFVQGTDAMTADVTIALTPRPAAPPPTTAVRPPPTSAVRPPPTSTVRPPPTTAAHPPETHVAAPPPSTAVAPPPPTRTAPPPETHVAAPPPSTAVAPPPPTRTTPPPATHAAPPPATEAPPDNPF